MEAFSPITRRILAAGLLILGALVTLQWLLLPLIGAIEERREELAVLWGRAAHLKALEARALPARSVLPPRSTIKAPAAGPALKRFKMAIKDASTRAGVELRSMAPHPAGGEATQQLSIDIDASGSEEALTRFVGLLEDGELLMRLESSRIQAGGAPDKPLILTGKLLAVWEREQ